MVLGIRLGSTDAREDIRPSRSFYELSQGRLIHITKPYFITLHDSSNKCMFALSSWCVMIAGCFSCRDLAIADSVSAETEAVNVMNGTSVKALSPPMLASAGWKSLPLLILTLNNL